MIDDTNFDIQDKKATIKQPLGTGSATYNNPNNKIIVVVDYEHFLNQQPNDVIKALDLKKCDFIVYSLDGNSFFILNELSLSSSSKNKINDARKQLHNALLHLSNTTAIKSFIDSFVDKKCVFSNKTKTIETPEDIAGSFDIIKSYLSEPIVHGFQPIEKLNFKLIETAIIDV
ncbi:hypothetical protein AGMMS49574_21460 [Bacteroidia bacterium]|nr:hypothetical protein AGMMS49574_21460 [Bacteroidia bacterium]